MDDPFARMLAHLCLRPRLYTIGGSFREVVAYLHGYDYARGQTIGMACDSEMCRFGWWLAERFGYERRAWSMLLLQHCGNDEQRALEQLWPLYEEYLNSDQRGSSEE
jgi:hypothetical protein